MVPDATNEGTSIGHSFGAINDKADTDFAINSNTLIGNLLAELGRVMIKRNI